MKLHERWIFFTFLYLAQKSLFSVARMITSSIQRRVHKNNS